MCLKKDPWQVHWRAMTLAYFTLEGVVLEQTSVVSRGHFFYHSIKNSLFKYRYIQVFVGKYDFLSVMGP